MAVDPTDPETFVDDDTDESQEYDVEAPRADAAEQHADVRPDRDDRLTEADKDQANEADLIEQTRVVSTDEDDYR
ncbi:hypothetical protein [Streptomyces sp. UG1]|uniref:hypothetical protein n=1 Tax=Streptomyces sp. UG1 TaxID=3417652 RepID=UPI003CF43A2E